MSAPTKGTILCTGGAGYIGSHTVLAILNAGFEIVIADNLCNSSIKCIGRLNKITGKQLTFENIDFTVYEQAESVFIKYPITGVIHLAALKSVGESVSKPLMYYQNNMFSLINILKAMEAHSVFNFVFSSSATVYAATDDALITESKGLGPINPYGQTKFFADQILKDLHNSAPSRWRISLLRYFNPVGNHPSGLIGESPDQPANLLPYVQQVAVGRRAHLTVFGNNYNTPDGTGVRDYVHVEDLADGHVAALNLLMTHAKAGSGWLGVHNLGTGRGYSVLELVKEFEAASGRPVPYVVGPPRPGDLGKVVADPSKANVELQWKATRSLKDACESAWKWQSAHPNGWADVSDV